MKVFQVPEQDIKPCSQGLMIKTKSGFVLLEGKWIRVEENVKTQQTESIDLTKQKTKIPNISIPTSMKWANGSTKFYQNGKLHRLDGPAVQHQDGTKLWYLDGALHRFPGPAIEHACGNKEWYFNGNLHREDGPAIVWKDGTEFWYLHGKRIEKPHRVDRPPVELDVSPDKIIQKSGKLIEKLIIVENASTAIKDLNGNIKWYKDGVLHRDDGPAVEYANGNKHWYLNNKLHRDDGPAVEYANGDKHWYLNGKLHRIDEPAIEHADGTKEWYQNGKRHRVDGPAIEWSDGTKEWYQNGVLQPDKTFEESK